MKITSRVFSTFLLIIILAVTLLTSLFLNLATPSLQAGTEPTKAAYLPLIMQPTDPNVTPTATPNPEDFANKNHARCRPTGRRAKSGGPPAGTVT